MKTKTVFIKIFHDEECNLRDVVNLPDMRTALEVCTHLRLLSQKIEQDLLKKIFKD